MKQGHLILLGGALVLVAALYFWQQWPQVEPAGDLYTLVAPGLDCDSIEAVEAWTGKDTAGARFRLNKRDGLWRVDLGFSAPAQGDRVQRLLQVIRDLRGERRASGRKDLFGQFGLEDDHALHLVLRQGGKDRVHLLVGKRGPAWDTVFLRSAGSDEVYLASTNLLALFDISQGRAETTPETVSWLDLEVLGEGPQEIEGVWYSRGATEWGLVAEGEGAGEAKTTSSGKEGDAATGGDTGKPERRWVFTLQGEKRAVTQAELSRFLEGLFPLYATGVVSPERAEEVGLSPRDQKGRLTVQRVAKGIEVLQIGRDDAAKGVGWLSDSGGVLYEVKADWLAKVQRPFSDRPTKARQSPSELPSIVKTP